MKKIFFYAAMTAFAVSVAGCSKDAEVSDIPAVGGKYTLASVSGSLDAEIGTRTGLGTNSVVNWSNKDRIAVINTKTNAITQYELVSGQGTSVGKFEPLSGSGASYDDISDLKAVYPAIAATVSNGVISFSLNQNYTQERRSAYGIGSWNEKDSPYSFTYNDIKVSYNTPAVTSGSTSEVNFKFKQLGTWCTFAFDLSQSPFKDETMEKMTITTTSGLKIGGTATVDVTSDPVAPKLGAGSVDEIEWTFSSSSALGSPFTRSLMLFPAVAAGEEMQIVCETEYHTITFFAKPTQDLSAGKVLRFPINEKFTADGTDFRYTAVEKTELPKFYYYGPHNSYLVYGTDKLDFSVMPYKSDLRFRKLNEFAPDATQPAKAKLLWKEGLTGITVAESVSNNTVSITGINGNGNAVVAITDASDNILWSYHIWVPEINPTTDDNLLTYAIPATSIGSGSTYKVMPIALGAMNKATVTTTGTGDNTTNPKSFGLYYQWGRKDPLGRPSTVTASGDSYVATTFDGLSGITKWNEAANMLDLSTTSTVSGETTDAEMIEYATKNPTKFIFDKDGKYGYTWTIKKNDHLWGNGSGYLFPRKGQIYKSIYDPCPDGYRVAPKDLWNMFTVDGGNKSYTSSDTDYNAQREANFNVANPLTLSTQHGYFFYYTAWHSGATDFYPASGYRSRASGALTNVGSDGYSWSSSPTQGSTYAGFLNFSASYVSPQNNGYRAYGFPVRCVRELD